MTDERTEDLLCHLYKVFYGDLKMCGCYTPEAGLKLVHELLLLAPFYKDERWKRAEELVGSAGAFQLVLSMLTEAGLLEHGSSIGGSWLAGQGRWVLWAVEQVGGIDGLDGRLGEEGGFPRHGVEEWPPPECTDACWTVPESWEPAPVAAAVPPVLVTVPCPGASCPQYLYGMPHEHTGG